MHTVPAKRRRHSPVEFVALMTRVSAYRLRPEPMKWREIAEKEDMSQRTLQNMWTRYEADEHLMDDALGIVGQSLSLYTDAIYRFAEVVVETHSDNVKVAALRSMLKAVRERLELLAAVGKIPRRVRAHEEAEAIRRMVEGLHAVLQRHEFPTAVLDEFLAVMKPVVLGETGQDVIEGKARELDADED